VDLELGVSHLECPGKELLRKMLGSEVEEDKSILRKLHN
jgi:hypothetical protein